MPRLSLELLHDVILCLYAGTGFSTGIISRNQYHLLDYDKVVHDLSPFGSSIAIVREALDYNQLFYLHDEIHDPFAVQWRDNHKLSENKRGTVIQNHDVFALKLSRGDQRKTFRVPRMRRLAANIGELIRGFSGSFPSLSDWQEDEMSLHKYDDQEIGLSTHRDHSCFVGMIAVMTLEGASDVLVSNEDDVPDTISVEEGDLTLMRAPGLYEPLPGKEIRPDHAVVNLKSNIRTSFIVRANNNPTEQVEGFEYDNWAGEANAT